MLWWKFLNDITNRTIVIRENVIALSRQQLICLNYQRNDWKPFFALDQPFLLELDDSLIASPVLPKFLTTLIPGTNVSLPWGEWLSILCNCNFLHWDSILGQVQRGLYHWHNYSMENWLLLKLATKTECWEF